METGQENRKDIKSLAKYIAELMDDKKAKDIKILDISDLSTIGSYFVICSADSSTQVRALTEYIKLELKKNHDILPMGCEIDKKNRWNLLDYEDIIVHIMHHEDRSFYGLENFWSLAKAI